MGLYFQTIIPNDSKKSKGITAQFNVHGLLADCSGIFYKNPRKSTKDSPRFLFHLSKKQLAHPVHSNCAAVPKKNRRGLPILPKL